MPTRKTRSRIVASAAALAVVTAAPSAYSVLDTDRASSSKSASSTVTRGKPHIDTHLYFGTGRPGGQPPVSDEEFLSFVDKHVTPKFPSGLTIHQGRGQWRNANGQITRERSYELNVLYPASEARAHDADIEQVRKEYKHAYGQESVLRTDDREQADF